MRRSARVAAESGVRVGVGVGRERQRVRLRGDRRNGAHLRQPGHADGVAVSIDAEIAKEFEPLEKGVLPVGSVTGNMVCSDMHLVCAFDSDRVGVR